MHIDRKLSMLLEQPIEALDQFIEVNRRSQSKAVVEAVEKADTMRATMRSDRDALRSKTAKATPPPTRKRASRNAEVE
jgi:hypothetical protein